MTAFVCICYNESMKKTKKILRDHVLAVKITADEKRRLTEYAEENSVNVSALVRRLLFNGLLKESS